MRALVTYSSQSGNTRMLAQEVFESLNCEKEMKPVTEATDPSGCDLVALGFWVQAGKPEPAAADYMAKIGAQDVFLFATHGAAPDSDHAKGAMAHARSLLAAARIRGIFSCQGEVDPKVLAKAGAKNPPPAWLRDAPDAVGHPDEADLQALRKAIRVAQI